MQLGAEALCRATLRRPIVLLAGTSKQEALTSHTLKAELYAITAAAGKRTLAAFAGVAVVPKLHNELDDGPQKDSAQAQAADARHHLQTKTGAHNCTATEPAASSTQLHVCQTANTSQAVCPAACRQL